MSPPPPRAVLFDCDGVLADSEMMVNALVAEQLTELGWPMSAAESRHTFLGMALPDMVPRIEARVGPLPPGWAEEISALIAHEMTRRTPAVPGATEAVHAIAAAGIPVSVASNSGRVELAAKMRSLGLATVFAERVFSFEDVDRPKPWPDIYLAAAAACGAAPADCVVVEDSVPGVRAGRAAGCRVLGFARETPAGVLAAHGAEPFDDMAALPGLLGLPG
ncbi:HAD family phosphatase [Roseomonas sp. PWR1]|uniref:HAD family phosphatase n=1 Tax=Roseomonas nitratireducens TaxID=2820810 RepID=A0ABS4AVD0_9PROT|nr:HAD family phosphatase [Neoroseomonas nitratireducens]MBP0465315.1 HAD family phosphatase [Neoroseomonas nitratireducens]